MTMDDAPSVEGTTTLPELPWPRAGDVLFSEAPDWWHNACVGRSKEQWYGYIEGYKQAANILVRQVVETRSDQDFLVFPIVFLFRQAVELSLKHLLFKGNQLLDRTPVARIRHKLVPLWEECRPIVEEVWPAGPKQDLDAVGEVLRQFEERDPGSTAFRYPVDTSGNASLPVSERINLRNLSDVANRALALLESCACGIGEYLEYKRENEWDRAR